MVLSAKRNAGFPMTIQDKMMPMVVESFVRQDLKSLHEWSLQLPEIWKQLNAVMSVHPMVYAYRQGLMLSFSFSVSAAKMHHLSFQIETVRQESAQDKRYEGLDLIECCLLKMPKTQDKYLRALHAKILR